MDLGLWNKIKQGFKKVGSVIKNTAGFINDKIIKPFQPAISAAINTISPTAGKTFDSISSGISKIAGGSAAFRPYKALG